MLVHYRGVSRWSSVARKRSMRSLFARDARLVSYLVDVEAQARALRARRQSLRPTAPSSRARRTRGCAAGWRRAAGVLAAGGAVPERGASGQPAPAPASQQPLATS